MVSEEKKKEIVKESADVLLDHLPELIESAKKVHEDFIQTEKDSVSRTRNGGNPETVEKETRKEVKDVGEEEEIAEEMENETWKALQKSGELIQSIFGERDSELEGELENLTSMANKIRNGNYSNINRQEAEQFISFGRDALEIINEHIEEEKVAAYALDSAAKGISKVAVLEEVISKDENRVVQETEMEAQNYGEDRTLDQLLGEESREKDELVEEIKRLEEEEGLEEEEIQNLSREIDRSEERLGTLMRALEEVVESSGLDSEIRSEAEKLVERAQKSKEEIAEARNYLEEASSIEATAESNTSELE